jgi:hypothetical protein
MEKLTGRFVEVGEIRNKILNALTENEDITKCLNYNVPDFLNKPMDFEPKELVYKKIFPYMRVPNVSESENTFITMLFKNFKLTDNGHYKIGSIWIHVITHKNLMRTDYGLLRSDFLLNKIDTLLNGSRDFGLGRFKSDDMSDMYFNDNFSGCCVIYKPIAFN